MPALGHTNRNSFYRGAEGAGHYDMFVVSFEFHVGLRGGGTLRRCPKMFLKTQTPISVRDLVCVLFRVGLARQGERRGTTADAIRRAVAAYAGRGLQCHRRRRVDAVLHGCAVRGQKERGRADHPLRPLRFQQPPTLRHHRCGQHRRRLHADQFNRRTAGLHCDDPCGSVAIDRLQR